MLSTPSTTTATNVTPATLTVTATGGSQVYDGTVNANVTLTSTALVGDNVSLAHSTATMADKNVGTNKAVSVGGLSISGPDASNYVLGSTGTNTTTNVTPATLTVSASGADQRLTNGNNVTVSLSGDGLMGTT